MRRFFFIFPAVIFTLLLCSCAYGDAALYHGARNIGAVPVIESQSGYYVPADGVGQLLGFASRTNGEEVLLSRGKISIRVMSGSAAAWRGTSIVPLQSPAVEKDGRIWIDSSSAVSLFQSSAGQGQANRLRFSKVAGASPTTAALAGSSRRDVAFGKFPEEPKPAAALPAIPIPTVQPKSQTPSAPVPAVQTVKPSAESPAIQTAQPTPATPIPAVQKTHDTPEVHTAESRTVKSTKSQPRHEAFKPDDSKKPVSESWSGTIQSIRWTDTDGTNRKIRAVIVADDNADPMVYMLDGKLHALFSSSLEDSKALASPYPDIKTELKSGTKGTELIFTPSGITRAEKTVLASPKRIVFDFSFPQNAAAAKTAPEQQKPSAPAPAKPEQPKQTPSPAQTAMNERTAQIAQQAQNTGTVKRADPIIIINSNNRQQSPAVTTPASTITIPAVRSSGGRKTIVVDPGHGGKDPGASANGVTEKSVNLGIGLELEKVLTAKGYNVIMTRNNDVYLKLQERTDIANDANADLFVSIHVNALPSKKSMTGFEIYIMALPTDKDAMNLAKIENREYVEGKGMDTSNVDRRTEMLLHILGDMQQNNKISESTDFAAALYNAGARNGLPMRRVAQAPFFVLRGAGMPAVLIETGFVTNATEAKKLTTSAYQQQIANAMAEGIANYLK